MKPWIKLLLSVALSLGVGAVSGWVTTAGVNGWYRTIQKPGWNAPDAVFAPVWTLLYILMGISFYAVWNSSISAEAKRPAVTFWIGQLVLNAIWPFLFFSRHDIGFAFIEIIVLWLAIFITIFLFARISNTAAWLLVPYISWVSFAAILNFAIWQIN